MWQLDNQTPFAADRAWTRGRDGAEIWLVAVKCTFDIGPDGTVAVAREQPPVVLTPAFVDPDRSAQSSLKYDLDLVRMKTTTDVVVLGNAYAPNGEPVTMLDVGFRVGPLTKQLRVTGDRVWQGNSISAPVPFTKVPLIYERAYGGIDAANRDGQPPQWDARNPVGKGFATSSSPIDGLLLANVEYPDRLVQKWTDRPEPAGFGPIASHWVPRTNHAGTYDAEWQQTRAPLLPQDFDDRYYQCAPVDQQASHFMRGGEEVTLVNLTPSGNLRFHLPRVFLGFETVFYTGESHSHEKPLLHTILLEPDAPRVSLVWHTTLHCHSKVYKLKKTEIVQKRLVTSRGAQTWSAPEFA